MFHAVSVVCFVRIILQARHFYEVIFGPFHIEKPSGPQKETYVTLHAISYTKASFRRYAKLHLMHTDPDDDDFIFAF